MNKKKNFSISVAIVTIAILLGSALLVPTLSAYADRGNDKPRKDDDSPKNQENDKGKGNSGGDHNGDD